MAGEFENVGNGDRESRRRMSVEAKQIEWVWEFFLKNCNDFRMIQELLNALPIPRENPDIQRMFFLRALSEQASEGIIDELTLDILRGISKDTKDTSPRRERHPAHFSRQEAPKRRKISEDESNDDEVAASAEGTISVSPREKDGRATSTWSLDQRRESSEDDRKEEAVVGIKNWMKGRALPRSMGGSGPSEEPKGCNLNYEVINAVNAGTPHGARDSPKGGEHISRPSEFAKQWELELAVMLELAVKHLRGDTPDRRSFEHAVTKYWGEPSRDDKDGCSVDMATVRDQLKSELSMVRKNPELLDGVVEKFTKARVEDMLKTYVEKSWVAIDQSFLERVNADVINGKYKPLNCNGQRGKKAGSPLMDGEVGHHSNGKLDTSEKPWIRASRGRNSRSLEKLQKNFAIGELDDDNEEGSTARLTADERNREDEEARAEQQAGRGSNRLDRQEDAANLKKTTVEGDEVKPTLSTEGGLAINARSQNFDVMVKAGVVVRVLNFDDHSGQEIEDGMQQCQEKRDCVRADIEATEAEDVAHQTDGAGALPCGGDDVDGSACSPGNRVPNIVKVPREVSDAMNLSEEKETSIADDEERTKEAISPTNADLLGPEPGCPHQVVNKETVVLPSSPKPVDPNPTNSDWPSPELGCPHDVVNKENVVPPSSHKPMDSNPTVCFSPPPWVEASPAVLVADGVASGLTRKRKSGSVQEESVTEFRKEDSKIAEAAAPTHGSNQSPGSTTTLRNLRRKQRVLDAVVQDPLPRILTSRSKGSLLERNATARTVEWDEDEIEESPSSSPSASRHVRLRPTDAKTISPLTSSKTSGTVDSKQARRKPRRWSEKEVDILKREVGKYGKGRWKMILGKNQNEFQGRTEVDLKDKWRNLERFEGIAD